MKVTFEQLSNLGLDLYIKDFEKCFLRKKRLELTGTDIKTHIDFIEQLKKYRVSIDIKIEKLDKQLLLLKKDAILSMGYIYEFVKIFVIFERIKKIPFDGALKEWLLDINIPKSLLTIVDFFDEYGDFKDSSDSRLKAIRHSLTIKQKHIRDIFASLIKKPKIQKYLIDRQIHFKNGNESLLLRGGFRNILNASIIGKSNFGYFYVVPREIVKLKQEEQKLIEKRQDVIYELESHISSIFKKNLSFLEFINIEFDRFDSYQARAIFAKNMKLDFLAPSADSSKIHIKGFKHPAIKNPIALDIDIKKNIVIITGVNSGGKSILLKSILAVSYMIKNVLPMNIDIKNSKIPYFKEIDIIISDIQNVLNNISTFTSRMSQFRGLFSKDNGLIGIDEIEMGTDNQESATLFAEILKALSDKGNICIVTTHNKHLAYLLSMDKDTQLLCAEYDESCDKPLFKFTEGLIGKSYGFEVAKRYIPSFIIKKAKDTCSRDRYNISSLIETNLKLHREIKFQKNILEARVQALRNEQKIFKEEYAKSIENFQKERLTLEKKYFDATNEIKKNIKAIDKKQMHKALNIATKIKKDIDCIKIKDSFDSSLKYSIKEGDRVAYKGQIATVISIKGDNVTIEFGNLLITTPILSIKPSIDKGIKKNVNFKLMVNLAKNINHVLDLRGMRAYEATEALEIFLSKAILQNCTEVLIIHGVRGGVLSRTIRNFLLSSKYVKSFSSASINMGRSGAKIVKL